MTNISSFDFPPPSDWQAFERLIRDLFEREWETDDAQANGRSGQRQAGVDVYGTDRRHNKWVGIQCKGRKGGYGGKVTEKELRDEVEKAKGFVPKLDRFILATTAPNDANIQKVARELNEKHRENRLFEVSVLSWDEIKAYLDRHPQVARGHLSGLSNLAQSVVKDAFTEALADLPQQMNNAARVRDISASTTTAPERNFSDDLLGQRITDAADLLNDSPAQAAIARLTKLLEQEGPNATNRNRFRIMANLGSAHAAKGDKAVAVDWYRQAYEEYPETAEGLSILAAAEAIDGNHEEAVNIAHRALALHNPQDRAVAVLLECSPADIPWKQLQTQIPQQFQNKPEFLLILAERAQIAGANKDYHQLIREAIRRDPQNWRVLSYAGYLRFREVMRQNQSLALGGLRGQDIELLTAAQTHFIAAWGSLKDSGYQSEAETTLINAISVSLLLHDDAALDDLMQVASGRFGDVTQLLRLRAAAQIQRGQHGIAANIIAKIPAADRSADDELMHLQAQINDGQSAEALTQTDKLYQDAVDEDLRIAYGHCRMMAAAQVDAGSFAQIAQELLSAHPSSTLLMSSYILNSPDNLDDPGIMDRLAEAVLQESNIFARDLAARALAKGERDSIAADILLGLCSPESDTPQLHLALKTLVNSRRIREARELYGKLSPSVRESASLRRIGAIIRQCDGDMKGARSELEALLGGDDGTLKDRAHWIDLCECLSDTVAIKRYLESVPVDLTGEPRGRMYMARKIDYYSDDHQKALEIGYRALRDGYDDPEIHAGYMIGLIMTGRSGRYANFERSQVAEDTVVVFARNQGDPVTRIIETAPTPRIDREEISPQDPLAQRLMGLAVGAEFPIEGLLGTEAATILAINSKYVHAYQRSQQDFERLFPENRILRALSFDDQDVEGSLRPILDVADARAEQVKRIEEAYLSGNAPIALLGSAAGGSPFDLWDFLRHHSKVKIRVALGTAFERGMAMRDVSAAPSLIIDPLTLYGVHCLGFADQLMRACPGLHITQSGINFLYEAHNDRLQSFGDDRAFGTLVKQEEGLRLVQIPSDVAERHIGTLAEILELAKSLPVAMPAEGVSLHPDLEAIFQGAGSCFVDTLIVAKERGWTALIDDMSFRQIAQTEGVPAVWSQIVLQVGRDQGRLTPSAYSDALGGLLDGNHEYVSIDASAIWFEWQRRNRSPWLEKFLDQISLPTNNPWSVAQLIGSIFIDIWDGEIKGELVSAFSSSIAMALSARIGAEKAETMIRDATAAALARTQRNARAMLLPARLSNCTSLVRPASLAAEINTRSEELFRDTIGKAIRF